MFIVIAIYSLPNKPWFSCVCLTSLLKTLWKKEKLLIMSNFCISHCVFYPSRELSAIFIKPEIVVCKLFQLNYRSLKFVAWKRVNSFTKQQNFSLVKIKSTCRRQMKCKSNYENLSLID